jgi:hypothetical protein
MMKGMAGIDFPREFRPRNSWGLCGGRRKYRVSRKAWGKIILSLLSLWVFVLPLERVGADPGSSEEEPKRPFKSYLVSLEYGWPAQFLSSQKYANFQAVTAILSREWEYRSLLMPEKWNLAESFLVEFRLSKIWGHDIPLMPDEVSPENKAKAESEGKAPTADWDHYQVAITPFYRFYYPLSGKTRLYAEAGAGFSWLNKPLVDNGTQWNFSIMAGVGIEREIYKIPCYAVLRAEHFSNGAQLWSKFGFDKSNIGLETAVVGIGVRFR